mgnify:CR=1 FL=1
MTIQRYEIDIERDEDEQGNPESILAPYRHDKGDWCKAEDVDALEARHERSDIYDYVKETTKDVALALMDYASQENSDYHEHHLMQIGGEKIRELEAEIERFKELIAEVDNYFCVNSKTSIHQTPLWRKCRDAQK